MNVLLDTHVLIWSVAQPDRIGGRARALLEDAETTGFISPISIWECLILADKGKVRLAPDPIAWTRRMLREQPLKQAPLNHEVAIQSRLVTLSHEDPADRFLAATAAVFELTLVTADEKLLRGAGYRVFSAE
jgi:PIN domain nuclease of toxin-antitoxin system